MTALEIATSMIDKLHEENRVQLETYHTARDRISYLEHQLADKNRVIKVLEERLSTGTEGILEMTNKQKDLTIKHLEAQIQKLSKENEGIEIRLEAIKSEICPKCETKLLLGESTQSKNTAKSYKPPGQVSSTLFEKKSSQVFSPNRLKTLERIVEHKDKRIVNLSKEVQRLTKIEKELTQKVYRLTKLMPISRLPPETITDYLLKEIQSLEAQGYKSNIDTADFSNKLQKDISSLSRSSKSKVYPSKSTDKFKKPSISNLKRSADNLLASSEQIETADTNGVQNVILFRKLQKLFTDVSELKHLFATESKKLSEELNTATTDYDVFKIHLEEIIDNLNEVVHSMIGTDLNVYEYNPSSSSDESLKKRLKDALAMITEYEMENKTLKERLNQLKTQQCFCSLDRRKFDNEAGNMGPSETQDVNEIKELKEIIKVKDNHINTCQKFIEELQKKDKQGSFEKLPSFSSIVEGKSSNCCAQDKKILRTKLDTSENNIKTLEAYIKDLQNSVCHLEGENERIESELHKARKTLSEYEEIYLGPPCSKISPCDTHVETLQQFNEELQSKIKVLEETNSKLEACTKLHEVEKASAGQEIALLKTKIEAAEKQIETLSKNVVSLKDNLQITKDEKTKLEANLKRITTATDLAEAYKKDIVSLENELSLKEEENRELKQSLQALEDSALQMNHYRKSLHKEIETLCKDLMENDDTEDSLRRKAIYKAAVLRSAQALLRLDENFNLKPEDSGRNSALEEMKHQIEVYLTEVSRIHELVTIKEQERDELLKEYLDLPSDAVLRPSPSTSLLHESHVRGEATDADLQSCPNLNPIASELSKKENLKYAVDSSETSAQLKLALEELEQTKSVTAFLLSSCTRLEDSLLSEKTEHAMCKRELELCKETVKDLETHLSIKNDMTKRLHSLIDMMRSKECNADITIEQLKSEIKWLIDKNQEIFENVATTRSELNQCKEENNRIQRDLDNIKRQLRNEQYENSKVSNELKHLRLQLSNTQCTLND